MNPVEIEEAVSALAERPFDRSEFPYAFLEAFGNKETTIKRLRSGASNKRDACHEDDGNLENLAVPLNHVFSEHVIPLKSRISELASRYAASVATTNLTPTTF